MTGSPAGRGIPGPVPGVTRPRLPVRAWEEPPVRPAPDLPAAARGDPHLRRYDAGNRADATASAVAALAMPSTAPAATSPG